MSLHRAVAPATAPPSERIAARREREPGHECRLSNPTGCSDDDDEVVKVLEACIGILMALPYLSGKMCFERLQGEMF